VTARSAMGIALFIVLASPICVRHLESVLTTHLTVQLPALVAVGILLAPLFARGTTGAGHGGPGVAWAISGALFFMLPRSMDNAVQHVWFDVIKFAWLPLCVGVPLARGWARISTVARGFLLANLLSMLGVLGWLYATAPVRFCNNYLQGDQQRTGHILLGIASGLALWLVLRAFVPRPAKADLSTGAPTNTITPARFENAPRRSELYRMADTLADKAIEQPRR